MGHPVASYNERRRKRRFPFCREMDCAVARDKGRWDAGRGRTLDISSNGIRFTTSRPLPLGNPVELSVDWPVLLDETRRLRLVIIGRIARSGRGEAAAMIDRYEFRLKGSLTPTSMGHSVGSGTILPE